jgi:histidyl-tRNA synthetase
VMSQLELFHEISSSSTDVLVLNFGEAEIKTALNIVQQLRAMEIKAELYPDQARLKKQMSYADSRKIPFIIIAGDEEIRNNELTIKIMSTGEQKKLPLGELESFALKEIKSKI